MSIVNVVHPGALTTVQDLGRVGYQKFGIPVTGVMDEYSFRLANLLVGNEQGEAALEVTLIGPELKFEDDTVFAITGADLSAALDGKKIPMYRSICAKKGSTLSFGIPKAGSRAYIAFAGTLNLPSVNGSKSTFIKSKIGGYEGRKLMSGDRLEILTHSAREGLCPDAKFIPRIEEDCTVRVVLGPQDDLFTEEGVQTFLNTSYTMTADSDRMGIRFDGAAITHRGKADIISDATVIGSVQVPANGLPIVLMADRQTTGGYTKIATVVRPDIGKLAQMSEGSKVRFEAVSIEEAQRLYRDFYDTVSAAESSLHVKSERSGIDTAAMMYALGEYIAKGEDSMKKYRIVIDGEAHEVEIEDISDGGSDGDSASSNHGVREQIPAPMPGNVLEVHVKEGDVVKVGQLLLIFEAMKMENEIKAPVSGTVVKVNVKVGDKVEKNAIFVEIE